VLDFMERSSIKLLKKRGNSDSEIARVLKRDRKTVRQALLQPAEKKYQRPQRFSAVDGYDENIRQWIQEELPVTVMLQKAREYDENPYQGGRTIFYQRVQLIRQELKLENQTAIWRFEGLPGEYLQIDWGEKRSFPFTQIPQDTRYCFVGRLKYSRFIYAEFHDNMRYETFIRCILRCCENLGGVPWVLVFDNTKTVAKGRNEDGNPIFNPKFRQFAGEIGFHPEVCALYSPNQKGTVENGVSFVKGNFLSGRTFLDDEELKIQLQRWLSEVNLKKCQAHGRIPTELASRGYFVNRLSEERKAFEPLVEKSDSYGLLHLRKVSPEAIIRFETNCYSVPEELIRQVVSVRVAEKELRIYSDTKLIAQHQRSFGKKQWIRDLSHYQKTLQCKPRAKVMAYREKLLGLDSHLAAYISEICRRDRNAMNQQILSLYALWEENGTEKLIEAVRFCHKEQVYGAAYVELILRSSPYPQSRMELLLSGQPIQAEIDRDLSLYDKYTHR